MHIDNYSLDELKVWEIKIPLSMLVYRPSRNSRTAVSSSISPATNGFR